MIKLNLPTEPRWLELRQGVRLLVRPADTALMAAARHASVRLSGEIRDDIAKLREVGADVSALPDLDDEDVRTGVAELLYAKALGRAAIIQWEGVGDDADGLAEVNPETIGQLMTLHPYGSDFVAAYLAPIEILAAEGNASRPAPNGTSATGPITAATAGTAAPPVPTEGEGQMAISAPTTLTSQ